MLQSYIQLLHKFSNLQNMAAVVLPENIPKELVQCFQQIKEYKTALPDSVIPGLSVLNYEQYILCQPKEICSLKLSLNKPVPPGREKFLTDVERNDLQEMYKILYGNENVKHVPLRYTQFHQVRVFEQIYTSMKSRTCRSSVVIAVWSHLTSILTTQPTMEDVRVGVIEYFLLHVPEIKINTSEEVSKQDHILVHII